MRRRHLLRLALASAAAALLPHGPGRRRGALAPRATLWSSGRTERAAARVGRAYLRRHPEEARTAELRRHLRELPLDAPRELGSRARTRIREDFACGQVVQVEGWLLSRTEVRLCALAALSA